MRFFAATNICVLKRGGAMIPAFPIITDIAGWVQENPDRLYRYLRYRKVYTPYEIQKAFVDESEFEDGGHFQFGFIKEVISIGGGDWLVGFQRVDMDNKEILRSLEYARLSDIQLFYTEADFREVFSDEETTDE